MLCNYNTEKLLGLKGVIVKNVRQLSDKTEIDLELPRKPHICPCCGHQTDCIHDYRKQTVKDIPAFDKSTVLVLRKRRYRCQFCGKRSFTSVAREVNLSVSTILRVFDYINYGKPKQMSEVVSIDEFKGNTGREKYQCILTDPVHHQVLDILPTRYSHYLTSYFKQTSRSETTHFVSDMWSTYAGIAQTYFKDAVYVIDKYHYIRQVFWAFEAIRKEEQKKFSKSRRIYFKHSRTLLNKKYEFLSQENKQQVDLMLYASSRLLTAYSLKEQFFKVLDCADIESARKALSHWIMAAQNSDLPKFIDCGNTLVRWSKGILNSFQCPYTNGFTEGINNKIKVLKRNAYGYRNFHRFRNRILHMFNFTT